MAEMTKIYVVTEPLGRPADIPLAATNSAAGDTRYSYYLEANGLLVKAGTTDIAAETQNIAAWTSDTQARLKGLMEEITSEDPPDFGDYLMYLGDIGVRYSQIIPRDVIEYVKDLPAQPVPLLYIYTPRHWIPWELIFDGETFWGDKCIVVRIPVVEYRHSEQSRSVLKTDARPIASVVNVVGDQVKDYVPAGEEPLLALDALLEKAETPSCNLQNGTWTPMTITSLRQQMEAACIVHLTCHGRFDESFGYYLQLSTGEHPRRYRLYSSLLQSQFYLDEALVFVNACTSDVPSLHYGTFINLGHEFFKSGAGSFIGTLAPVPIKLAVRLAHAFYDSLLQGESVGISLHKAKQAMKEEQNPFWLFYCLYGNALGRYAAAD